MINSPILLQTFEKGINSSVNYVFDLEKLAWFSHKLPIQKHSRNDKVKIRML